MKIESAELLVLVARLLDYPDQEFFAEKEDLEGFVKKKLSSEPMAREFIKRCEPLLELDQKDLQELYVDTFDYKEKTGLYLTAQELGDSRKRGMALIQLQKLIENSGFERTDNELADYIPMLLELLAVAEETEEVKMLHRRLAYSIHRILNYLPRENLYYGILETLMLYVFKKPSKEEIKLVENAWEEADLEQLPYPMLYQ